MKRITPNILVVAGLIILITTLLVYHTGEVKRFNSEIHELQLVLNHTETNLAMVTDSLVRADAALKKERALVIEGSGVRNFQSLDELKEFLAEDDTDKHEYIETTFDCDDFAFMLQGRAFEKGFIINCQKLPVGGIEHMHNLAIAGNELYYVEARTDEVTFAGYVD